MHLFPTYESQNDIISISYLEKIDSMNICISEYFMPKKKKFFSYLCRSNAFLISNEYVILQIDKEFIRSISRKWI